MIIGILNLEIYLPSSHSLKNKRKHLNSIRDRLKNRYNVAFAELDYQNKWQRTKMGVVTVNAHRHVVEKCLSTILKDIEDNIEGEILQSRIEYL